MITLTTHASLWLSLPFIPCPTLLLHQRDRIAQLARNCLAIWRQLTSLHINLRRNERPTVGTRGFDRMFTYAQKAKTRLIEMELTDLTQKSAEKTITDHPIQADQDHILIRFNPCSATRNSSTPGEQELSPSRASLTIARLVCLAHPHLGYRLKWWSIKLNR
ncbi:uncharacterized protein BKA55DRAFT_573292 [Fusarium redolens]|jgi:hypothetical protein|uniref:Uncharacterized protein n=1 Tax=Fusarium redolens TaxID=48865 RepID=A0A9P9GR62_FUSRE|nr:uncharacterized protein BKA55DRAFT_573292 [Fusarium redolens]KAH7244189.1 hypothetical protein BKA55DRAFT_573292 [Fusarium redolens]